MLVRIHFQIKWSKVTVTDYDQDVETFFTKSTKELEMRLSISFSLLMWTLKAALMFLLYCNGNPICQTLEFQNDPI